MTTATFRRNAFGLVQNAPSNSRNTGDSTSQKDSVFSQPADSFSPNLSLTLRKSIAPGWSLITPISLKITVDDNNDYIVTDAIFLQYGIGNRIALAIQDYINNLIDYYKCLEPYATDDEPETQALFSYLQRFLINQDR